MASCLGTHPLHENFLASGGVDGMVYLWDVRAVGQSVSVSFYYFRNRKPQISNPLSCQNNEII